MRIDNIFNNYGLKNQHIIGEFLRSNDWKEYGKCFGAKLITRKQLTSLFTVCSCFRDPDGHSAIRIVQAFFETTESESILERTPGKSKVDGAPVQESGRVQSVPQNSNENLENRPIIDRTNPGRDTIYHAPVQEFGRVHSILRKTNGNTENRRKPSYFQRLRGLASKRRKKDDAHDMV